MPSPASPFLGRRLHSRGRKAQQRPISRRVLIKLTTPEELANWIQAAGFRHLAVISWPHVEDAHMLGWARATKGLLARELGDVLGQSSVFLDETAIKPGENWRSRLAFDLCRSVSMVPIIAPPYFMARHEWCGIEWEGMSQLGKLRLPSGPATNIIPLIFRDFGNLGHMPSAVTNLQYVDVSALSVSPRFATTKKFRIAIRAVAEQIFTVADLMMKNGAIVDCAEYTLPSTSAFIDYIEPPVIAPLRDQPASGSNGHE